MLNQASDRSVGNGTNWCVVGEPPVRWDVSFGARLAEKVKQLFWRDTGERAVPVQRSVDLQEGTLRKAA
jgi:hypothetical protein